MGQNIIELNGKRYDALTGSFLGEGSAPVARKQTAPVGHRGRFIDGFVKTPKPVNTNATQAHAQLKPAAPFIPVHPAPSQALAKPKLKAAKHVAAHHPEHAKTLMRSAVAKPKLNKKPVMKAQIPAEVAVKPAQAIVPKLSAAHIDPRRLEHAKDVKQSETIKKFTPAQRQAAGVSRAHIAAAPVRGRAPQPNRTTAAQQPVQKQVAMPKPIQKTEEDIFEKALARANSHEQPKPARALKKQRNQRRLVNALAGLAAFLVIGGFVAYLNAPNIELRVASVRAGFHATLPSYQPVGYAMGRSVQLHNKQVSVSFHSDSGSSFKLTQEPSSWDSSTLFDNVVAATNKTHQTIESNGRTIYLFGDTNAAWVNNGVLYQITGSAELSNSQISQLAASI
ncbi:MAG TPA: hypothetical protein VJR27_03635 [Candidatus Saccharimonadales bacterium]|nr:hypothetical protein [Candidatus Saccharimonadales bacterium]